MSVIVVTPDRGKAVLRFEVESLVRLLFVFWIFELELSKNRNSAKSGTKQIRNSATKGTGSLLLDQQLTHKSLLVSLTRAPCKKPGNFNFSCFLYKFLRVHKYLHTGSMSTRKRERATKITTLIKNGFSTRMRISKIIIYADYT